MQENSKPAKIRIKNLDISYSGRKILSGVNADIPEKSITCLSGASGQGKTSLLMCINRLIDETKEAEVNGSIEINMDGKNTDILNKGTNIPWLRKKIPLVLQAPSPLPMSIYRNMSFPLRIAGVYDRKKSPGLIESALKRTGLWEEVKDRLDDDPKKLSGGQIQRLCIARAVVMNPEIILLDEPSASLDSYNAGLIAEMMKEIKKTCTVIAVTHNQEIIGKTSDIIFEVKPLSENPGACSSLYMV